jgi:hypothetical protein
MSEQSKLYKCYKEGCYFRQDHTDGPFLTQMEFDSILNDGKLNCPEDNENCGLQELKLEDYPKPIKDNKKLYTLICGAVGLVALTVFLFMFFTGNKKESTETVQEPVIIETPISEEVQEVLETVPVVAPEAIEPVKPEPVVETPVQAKPTTLKNTTPSAPKGTQTKNFSGGSKYVGEMQNGEMQGLGTFYYGQHELISPRDLKKRYAEAGDYLIGEFYEGKVVSGKLYDSSNTLKEVMMIGR